MRWLWLSVSEHVTSYARKINDHDSYDDVKMNRIGMRKVKQMPETTVVTARNRSKRAPRFTTSTPYERKKLSMISPIAIG